MTSTSGTFNIAAFQLNFNFLVTPEFVQASLETVNRLCFDYDIW